MTSSRTSIGLGEAGPSGSWRDREGGEGSFADVGGNSRAVRCGSRIGARGAVAIGAPLSPSTHGQAVDAMQRFVAAAESLRGRRDSIICIRLYLTPGADWEAAASAHRELLGDIAPADATLSVGAMIGTGFLIEVETDVDVEAA